MNPRASLPAVDRLLDKALVARFGHARVVRAARGVLDTARRALGEGGGAAPSLEVLRAEVAARLTVGVTPIINATGVVLHTNLGRAPWSPAAIEAARGAAGYCTVELDARTGRRGARGAGVADRLAALTGAQSALVVNNCAAAVLLLLRVHAPGRPVIVSRGELVEIGGGFRVPDVLRASGAQLVEVGTTNRTHLADYQRALAAEPEAVVLRVHPSNFRQIGFVSRPTTAELATLEAPLFFDLGSGAVDPVFGEPTLQDALKAGADVVCASGDKLLGGPQAGLVLGSADFVDPMGRHPLFRALRVDKVILAALEATLDDWLLERPLPARDLPGRDLDALRRVVEGWAEALADVVAAEPVEVDAVAGGGSLPGRTWPSWALALPVASPEAVRAALLAGSPPVLGRVRAGALHLDARTVRASEAGAVPALVRAALAAAHG